MSEPSADKRCSALVPPELEGHLGFLLSRCRQKLIDQLDVLMARDQLSIRHFVLVSLLERRGGMSQAEIGEFMLLDRTTTMKLVSELQARGLLARRRRRDDRRANAVDLTDAGREWLRARMPEVLREESTFLSPLSQGEQALMKELLVRLMVGAPSRPA